MVLAQWSMDKSTNLFHLRARPVRSPSACNLNGLVGKAFLGLEGHGGTWVSGLDGVEVLCIGSSLPSECRSKVSIGFYR